MAEDKRTELIHRDEIHGDVYYDPLSVALLDSGPLQRLGRVYQLGYGHLVYRGGNHTRLAHSMGAYFTAARLVDAMRHNYETKFGTPFGALEANLFLPGRATENPGVADDELALAVEDLADNGTSTRARDSDRWIVLRHLVCWAALLHDVGHVPMGHTLEDEFDGIYMKHDDLLSPRLRHLWLSDVTGAPSVIVGILRRMDLYPEAFHRLGLNAPGDVLGAVRLTCMFKEEVDDEGTRSDFGGVLEEAITEAKSEADKALPRAVLADWERLNGGLFGPYMADIVANTISADYLDYLRRDPRNLGLDVLRDDRVVSRFWVGHDHLNQPRMALALVDRRGKERLDTCTGVVELVRQRYRFAEIVYYHKTKVAASAMLAKVFGLVGKPDEVPSIRPTLRLDEIGDKAAELVTVAASKRRKELSGLRTTFFPTALLDPEIGDESLGFLLAQKAWKKLEEATKTGDESGVRAALQGLSLLHALARRDLYKVCFRMNAPSYADLSGHQQEGERALQQAIKALREDEGRRAEVEQKMVAATGGWPENSLLLYVPPRKSQAKGILTGALAGGGVATLGTHPAVKSEVKSLSDRYADLWRLNILVHPSYIQDAVGLSCAIDAFMADQFPGSQLEEGRVLGTLKAACWFAYLPRRDRDAAKRAQDLAGDDDSDAIDFTLVASFKQMIDGNPTDEEIAEGVALSHRLEKLCGRAKTERILRRFRQPGSLHTRVERLVAVAEVKESREGAADQRDELAATRDALRDLAQELATQ